ncbi:AsmA family protein [Klebsiella variicola]|nr:AsmA family protein [Klebsiella variicola]
MWILPSRGKLPPSMAMAGELQLVKNGSWGVWNGSATLNAAAATFNRIDVRRPSLKLSATASTVNITELSAFTERGILQATARYPSCRSARSI